jgi:hypothetical protein
MLILIKSYNLFVLSYFVSLSSEFCVVMSSTISELNWCSVRHYLQLFVGGLISYLRYLCLFAYSDIQHILCCVFVLFSFVFVYPMLPVSLDCKFWLPLRYSLTFIYLVYPMLPVSLDCKFWLPLRYSLTFIYLVYPMLPVSLDCKFWLTLRYSLTFI